MLLSDAILAAGEGGTIRRESWPAGDVLLLARVTLRDDTLHMKLVRYERAGDLASPATLSGAEKAAIDWSVVARSSSARVTRSRPSLRVVGKE